ncbi:MAG: carboxypeptidase-like regulatory domain-containing protein, partial [Candidatus Heimdallarchaeota archaeon]|nr:carboxypeptidase-like regulatory domain-containing protein [Candidatus Heimdallarchaeota archaeon]
MGFNLENTSVEEILEEIEDQSEYNFLYRSDLFKDLSKVDINVENASVEEILDEAIVPHGFTYEIVDKTIVIRKTVVSAPPVVPAQKKKETKIRINGKVSDKVTGEALPGAAILIKNTTTGTITNLRGEFTMIVPDDAVFIIVSFLGYESQEIEIKAPYFFDISLTPGSENLGEVLVTSQAKGQMGARLQQINSPTIVNVIAAEKLQQNPDANAVEAVGRLPGISVDRQGGEGAGFKIRGLGSEYSNVTINGEPLPVGLNMVSSYALQGVEVYKSLTPNLEGNAVGGT